MSGPVEPAQPLGPEAARGAHAASLHEIAIAARPLADLYVRQTVDGIAPTRDELKIAHAALRALGHVGGRLGRAIALVAAAKPGTLSPEGLDDALQLITKAALHGTADPTGDPHPPTAPRPRRRRSKRVVDDAQGQLPGIGPDA